MHLSFQRPEYAHYWSTQQSEGDCRRDHVYTPVGNRREINSEHIIGCVIAQAFFRRGVS